MSNYPVPKAFPIAATMVLASLMIVGQQFPALLQYNQSAISNGEFWRLFTCHFVHTGWIHLLMNLIAATILFKLFSHFFSPWHWSMITVGCAILISIGLLAIYPKVVWYVGLSGLLYAWFTAGSLRAFHSGEKVYGIGLLLLAVKVIAEQIGGSTGLTSQLIQAEVITEAHLMGSVTGALIVCVKIAHQKLITTHASTIEAG